MTGNGWKEEMQSQRERRKEAAQRKSWGKSREENTDAVLKAENGHGAPPHGKSPPPQGRNFFAFDLKLLRWDRLNPSRGWGVSGGSMSYKTGLSQAALTRPKLCMFLHSRRGNAALTSNYPPLQMLILPHTYTDLQTHTFPCGQSGPSRYCLMWSFVVIYPAHKLGCMSGVCVCV